MAAKILGELAKNSSFFPLKPPTLVWGMLGSSDILGLILTMRNDDLAPIGTVLRYQLASTANNQFSRQPDFVVDLEPVFGKSASPEALLSNGFQPSLAGQKAIATAVVESLTA